MVSPEASKRAIIDPEPLVARGQMEEGAGQTEWKQWEIKWSWGIPLYMPDVRAGQPAKEEEEAKIKHNHRVWSIDTFVMKVAVIGGGPSGLVTLKYLVQAHEFLGCEAVEARLFEYQPRVGGTFSARVYEDAEVSGFYGPPRGPRYPNLVQTARVFEAADYLF